jgi:hypothetical protein
MFTSVVVTGFPLVFCFQNISLLNNIVQALAIGLPGSGVVMNGAPQLTLDKSILGLVRPTWSGRQQSSLFPQAHMPSVQLKSSTDKVTDLSDFLP